MGHHLRCVFSIDYDVHCVSSHRPSRYPSIVDGNQVCEMGYTPCDALTAGR